MNSFLIEINKLLHPYVLGFQSDNNGGCFLVTDTSCQYTRGFGYRKWSTFVESTPNIHNVRLEVVTQDFVDSSAFAINENFVAWFLENEGVRDGVHAAYIMLTCKPYILARFGDPQGQYHYCLVKSDPLKTDIQQKVAYIFPGTQMDLYDLLPETDIVSASPMVGGSLGWLAHLDSQKTIAGIIAAKKRLS